jgi:hypothetical protein
VCNVCAELIAHGAAAGPQQLGHGAVLRVPAAHQRRSRQTGVSRAQLCGMTASCWNASCSGTVKRIH